MLPETALGARKPKVRELRKRIRRVAPVGKRRLVVLDCGGGNDGLSMFPLKGDGASAQRYRALRPRTAIAEESMLPIHGSDVMGMHPSLSRIRTWNPAIVTGIGVAKPDLSHFEMMRRWWSGDQDSLHVTVHRVLRPHLRRDRGRRRIPPWASRWATDPARRSTRSGSRRCP